MGILSSVLRNTAGNRLSFLCPGCDMPHSIQAGDGPGPRWTYNGNAEKPTFRPSVLLTWDQLTPAGTTPELWAKIKAGEIKQTKIHHVCHSFVTDGRVQFLGDCTHALAGQTVDLPDFGTSEWADWER